MPEKEQLTQQTSITLSSTATLFFLTSSNSITVATHKEIMVDLSIMAITFGDLYFSFGEFQLWC
jgi:hypothetical protein